METNSRKTPCGTCRGSLCSGEVLAKNVDGVQVEVLVKRGVFACKRQYKRNKAIDQKGKHMRTTAAKQDERNQLLLF